jgi:flagellar biosynthesis/type III secretory pathway protein FliH
MLKVSSKCYSNNFINREIKWKNLFILKNVMDKSRREEVDNTGKTIAQSLIEEGIEKGIEKGIERGIKRGRKEGIKLGLHQGMQLFLIDTLEIRFEIVPSNLVEAINNITETKVLRLR